MTAELAWIHLSDIHFGHGTDRYGYDQELVVAELAKDAARVVEEGPVPRPQVMIVTGDIANTANARDTEEYQRAADWLEDLRGRLGIDRGRVLVVPGNHDVNRAAGSASHPRRLVGCLRHGDQLDEALGDDDERALLASRFEP